MRMGILLPVILLSMLAVCTDVYGGVGYTNCGIMPDFRDNLTVKVDVSDGQLRVDKEGSFRVYLNTTSPRPFWNAKVEVVSEQFDATVTPSPHWKTYPDVQSAVTGGTREYFTVNLKRKDGVPDGKYDVSLRVYTSRYNVPKLARVVPVAEALDQHDVPFKPALQIDGKPRPQDWTNTLLLTSFSSYGKGNWGFVFNKPANQTRIHLAADNENVYMLVSCMGSYDRSAKGNELKIYLAPQIETKPLIVTLDESTGQIAPNPAVPDVKCVKCADDPDAGGSVSMYEIAIPRKFAGAGKNLFYLNFRRTVAGQKSAEVSYWRGNEGSVNDPVTYGRMVIHAK